jgi:FtsP/CotA-like multicopper oxidase with cupredoxin domain
LPRESDGHIIDALELARIGSMLPRQLLALAAALAVTAFAAGPTEKTFNLSIVRGSVAAEQRVLRVEKGDAVRVRLTSDTPGEIHLHGYRLEARLVPDIPAEFSFKAYATGRFPLEWHAAGGAAPSKSHHGPPLAVLEVRPK